MRSLVFAAGALALAEGGSLKLGWKDCGATHGKVIGLTPDTVPLGQKSTATGSGTVDQAVSGGTFEIDLKASIISQTFKGDLCQSKSFSLPLGTGTITWDGIKCPVAAGAVDIPMDLQLSSFLPGPLQNVQMTIKGADSSNNDLLCMQINTSPAEVAAAPASSQAKMQKLFKNFMEKYERHYATEAEKNKRFQIFSDNVEMILFSNAKNGTFTLGVTSFTDRTQEEWRMDHMTGFKPPLTAAKDRDVFTASSGQTVPDSVDWVTKGGVTSVKNQGTCGSCWTFSTVGALEGAMFVAGWPLVDLSMQHILACDTGGNGCKGGQMDQAFDWVATNGVPALKDEPYLCKDASASQCTTMTCSACTKRTGETCIFGTCNNFNATCNKEGLLHHCECPGDMCFKDGACGAAAPVPLVLSPGDVTKHTDVSPTEDSLEAAVAQQPVSVAIEADQFVFQHYTGGVLTNDACGSNLDHGVLAVGYGIDNGQKYWKVKNSWDTVFGEQGYIRIEKGKASDGGECGIRKMASFPTVKAKTDMLVV